MLVGDSLRISVMSLFFSERRNMYVWIVYILFVEDPPNRVGISDENVRRIFFYSSWNRFQRIQLVCSSKH